MSNEEDRRFALSRRPRAIDPFQLQKASDKNPFRFQRRVSAPYAYDPEYQADEAQFAEQREAFRHGFVPLNEVTERTHDRNAPPALIQAPWRKNVTIANQPVLLIPGNVLRMSFIIGAQNTTAGALMFMNYGPVLSPFGANDGFGIPILISPAGVYQEANGTVSIDDIWITCSVVPTVVMGFEGQLAIRPPTHDVETRGHK